MYSTARRLFCALVFGFMATIGIAQTVPQINQITTPQLWKRLEFSINYGPFSVNPFDPDKIRLDATITLPSGHTTTVPAFWYQAYQRSLSGGYESDAAVGASDFRLRYT